MLSKRPGEIFEPVTAIRIGWKPCRGFSPSSLEHRAQRRLDRLRRERLELGERVARRRDDRRRRRRAPRGSTSWKRKPANAGNSPSFAIFSCTSGAAARISCSSQS